MKILRQTPPVTNDKPHFRTVIFPTDPDEPVEVDVRDASYDGMQACVGGQVEVVSLDGAAIGVNAYGLALRLAANARATQFMENQRPGFLRSNGLILGPVLLVGFDENGDPADVL